jgi:hypothetical protein
MQGLQVEGVYRQGMAPASASPQPPSGRSDPGDPGEQESDAARSKALAAPESDTTPREAPNPHKLAHEQAENYGPLSVERQIKQDGRALILYARLKSPDR